MQFVLKVALTLLLSFQIPTASVGRLPLTNFTEGDSSQRKSSLREKKLVVKGDIYLGVLLPVHERYQNSSEVGQVCGPIRPIVGMQAVEALLFTLDSANRLGLVGPHLRLGAIIMDDCNDEKYGLEQAMEIIKAPASSGGSNLNSDAQPIIGFITGPTFSSGVTQLTSMLKALRLPQVQTTTILAEPIAGFKEYFLGLRPDTNTRNPWFTEFWEDYFDCWLPGGPQTPYNQRHKEMCGPELRMSESDAKFVLEPQLQFVSDAVMAFAVALRELRTHLCLTETPKPVCLQRLLTEKAGLLTRIGSVSFTGRSGSRLHLLKSGDASPPLRIGRPQYFGFGKKSSNSFGWTEASRFDADRGDIQLHRRRRRSLRLEYLVLCAPNENGPKVKFSVQISSLLTPNWNTAFCPKGTLRAYYDGDGCQGTVYYFAHSNPITIVAIVINSAGLLASQVVLGVLEFRRSTPVVRASGRALNRALLLGVGLCFLATCLMGLRPSSFNCGIQWFVVGLSFAFCSAGLLLKMKHLKRGDPMSDGFQVLYFVLLVLVQIIVLVVTLNWHPPSPLVYYSSDEEFLQVCSYWIGPSSLICLVYPLLLALFGSMCFYVPKRTPGTINDKNHVIYALNCTCLILLALACCLLSSQSPYQSYAALCYSTCLAVWAVLVCIFGPKMYILLLHPELNVSEVESQQQQQPQQLQMEEDGADQSLMDT